MEKRLYRSNTRTVVGGVCGGIGEYFEIDPAFIRILFVLLALANGIGVLVYIASWIIIPRRPLDIADPEPTNGEYRYANWHKYIPGMALIALGILLLMRSFWYWFSWGEIFAVMLILAGATIIITRMTASRHAEESPYKSNKYNGPNGGGAA